MQRRMSIKQHEHFPHPLMLVGDVTMSRDFEKSTRDNPVQAVDKETGLRIYEAEVVNTDPEARKGDRSFTVKLLADKQPVPPEAPDGSTMRPVVFRHLEAMPWLDDRMCNGKDSPHKCRAKIAWSYRASGFEDTSGSGSGSSTSSSASAGESSSKSSGRSAA